MGGLIEPRRVAERVVVAWAVSTGILLADFASATAAPWSELVRPVTAVGLLSLAVGLIPAPTVLSLVLVLAVVRPAIAMWIFLGIVAWIAIRRLSRIALGVGDGRRWAPPTWLPVLALSFAIVSSFTAVAAQGWPLLPTFGDGSDTARGGESVYVLLLDGYPRQDILLADFGYDNEPFLRELEDRGFRVDRTSQSLYHWSPQAVAHLLGVDVPELNDPTESEWRHLRQSMDTAPLPRQWRSEGYDVTFIRSPVSYVTPEGAFDSGQVNEMEVTLIGRSVLAPMARSWVIDQQRSRLEASLEAVVDRAESSQVVIAHLMAPHIPFYALPAPDCWPRCNLWRSSDLSYHESRAEYAVAWHAQLEYVNGRILVALDHLIEADPEGAIILFSDHGERHQSYGHADWYSNLYAVRGVPAVELRVPNR